MQKVVQQAHSPAQCSPLTLVKKVSVKFVGGAACQTHARTKRWWNQYACKCGVHMIQRTSADTTRLLRQKQKLTESKQEKKFKKETREEKEKRQETHEEKKNVRSEERNGKRK